MDQLEKYIRSNRDQLDSEVPPQRVRDSLFPEVQQGKAWYRRLNLAAAVALIGLSVYGILFIQSHQNGKNNMVQLPEEIQEAEVYYASLIQLKSSEIKELSQDFPELTQELNAEMDTLDKLYEGLKETYAVKVSDDLVADEMIKNLQLRVEVLNRQIELLEQLKEYKNENFK